MSVPNSVFATDTKSQIDAGNFCSLFVHPSRNNTDTDSHPCRHGNCLLPYLDSRPIHPPYDLNLVIPELLLRLLVVALHSSRQADFPNTNPDLPRLASDFPSRRTSNCYVLFDDMVVPFQSYGERVADKECRNFYDRLEPRAHELELCYRVNCVSGVWDIHESRVVAGVCEVCCGKVPRGYQIYGTFGIL